MVRKSVKITVCTMAAVMAFSGMNITADAAASSSVLPSGGIELTLAKGNKLESLSAGTNNRENSSPVTAHLPHCAEKREIRLSAYSALLE